MQRVYQSLGGLVCYASSLPFSYIFLLTIIRPLLDTSES
jgi:hypothetical protein